MFMPKYLAAFFLFEFDVLCIIVSMLYGINTVSRRFLFK